MFYGINLKYLKGRSSMKAVKVVRDPTIIKILADLVRKEILRLTAIKPLTETQLAEKVLLTKPSMSHHLRTLLKAGLIKITKTRVGPHGILEKYYEPIAKLFIEDWEKVPPELKRYFLHSHMERVRGMLSVFYLIAENQGQKIEIRSEEVERLAQEIAKRVAIVAEKYEDMETDIDRETLLIKIYSETLKMMITEIKWKNFFPKIINC